MKGTLISILVGALAGALLTVGPALRSSHAEVARHAPVDAVSSRQHADGAAQDATAKRDDSLVDAERAESK